MGLAPTRLNSQSSSGHVEMSDCSRITRLVSAVSWQSEKRWVINTGAVNEVGVHRSPHTWRQYLEG